MKYFRNILALVLAIGGLPALTLSGQETSPPQRDISHILAIMETWFGEGQVPEIAKVDHDTVYGMYSGLALLMDVYYPQTPNGYGIVQVSGSGFTRQLRYDARQLKHSPHVPNEAQALLSAGYTIFALNHRAAPRFRYPDQVADVQRAVRFIRHHADRYGIDEKMIGAIGGSSGGYLVSMLGVLDGDENRMDEDPINLESGKVQCVIAAEAPSDFLEWDGEGHFLGVRYKERTQPNTIENKLAVEASPVTHVSPDDAPILLVHGDADEDVPFRLSELFFKRLTDASVSSRFIRVPGGQHAFQFFDKRPKDLDDTYVKWFNQHLRGIAEDSHQD
ncbi:MAG: alpha/beta hydrolase [Rubripirellula sp.]|nr:alpha/beta hydrolase [Rubripirellula sp.]